MTIDLDSTQTGTKAYFRTYPGSGDASRYHQGDYEQSDLKHDQRLKVLRFLLGFFQPGGVLRPITMPGLNWRFEHAAISHHGKIFISSASKTGSQSTIVRSAACQALAMGHALLRIIRTRWARQSSNTVDQLPNIGRRLFCPVTIWMRQCDRFDEGIIHGNPGSSEAE